LLKKDESFDCPVLSFWSLEVSAAVAVEPSVRGRLRDGRDACGGGGLVETWLEGGGDEISTADDDACGTCDAEGGVCGTSRRLEAVLSADRAFVAGSAFVSAPRFVKKLDTSICFP